MKMSSVTADEMVTAGDYGYLRIWTVTTLKKEKKIRKMGGREALNSFITLRGEYSES